jgi:hypothetical protein
MTYFMEMGTTPLCGVLASVAVEYCEEALAADTAKVDDERVGILHRSPCTLVFGDADLVRGILGCMAI